MSYDFAVLVPDALSSRDDALGLDHAMCAEVMEPAPTTVADFVSELNRDYGTYVDDRNVGFLMVDAEPDARGTVVCTSWQTIPHNTRVLLELTRDHGLLLYDPQLDRLYDPRGRVDLEVSLGEQVLAPYLSESLLVEYFEHPARDNPFLIVHRDDEHFAQAYIHSNADVAIEYRDGGRDAHYAALTPDPVLARAILWNWAVDGERWRTAINWMRIAM